MTPLRLAALSVLLLCLGQAGRAQDAPRPYPPLSPKESAELDRQWRGFQRAKPDESSRDVYAFILTAAARGWHPETLAAVIDHVEQFHELDPHQKAYGNYRWYRRDVHPDDLNAVEFCMQTASLAWILYRDRLTPEAREKLEASIRTASAGVIHQPVKVDYTNIFLMRLENAILIGQSTGQPELVEQGKAWLDEWLAYTRANGIHEFSSPTYYGVDLADLGALSRFAADPEVREKANRALRLIWTDIAANWFGPHQGISGANSRDYGFLTGHGYLDQQLMRAHWLKGQVDGESRPVLDDLTHVDPPPGIREQWGSDHRIVSQRYGPNPGKRAHHYVGHHFTIGSAGEMYGAQDRMFALTFDGGPKQPIASFSLDYRDDPYGQGKVTTSGGHAKLTHLQPLIGTVQNGPEVLQVAYLDPAHTRNPAGKGQVMAYAGITATLTLPRGVEVWSATAPIAEGQEAAQAGSCFFLRSGSVLAVVNFVLTRGPHGETVPVHLVRDGDQFGAQRLSAELARGTPSGPVAAALWVRAEEGRDDAQFATFRERYSAPRMHATLGGSRDQLAVEVPAKAGRMGVVLDLKKQVLVSTEGADPAMEQGILNVNGTDVGTDLLR